MRYCEKKAWAYIRGYNNCRLRLKENLCILEYAENNKLLNKKKWTGL